MVSIAHRPVARQTPGPPVLGCSDLRPLHQPFDRRYVIAQDEGRMIPASSGGALLTATRFRYHPKPDNRERRLWASS